MVEGIGAWPFSNLAVIQEQLALVVNVTPGVAFAVGIAFTIIGSCLMAVGSVIMKLGIHAEAKAACRRPPNLMPLWQPIWWMGFGTYGIGALLHAFALAYAPASVLAPLNSFGLVANAGIAATVLGEPFGTIEGIGTVGTTIGVSLCAIASLHPDVNSVATSGLDSWSDVWYLTYLGVVAFCTFASLVYVNHEETKVSDLKWERRFVKHVEEGHIEMGDLALTASDGIQRSFFDSILGGVVSGSLGDRRARAPPNKNYSEDYHEMSRLIGGTVHGSGDGDRQRGAADRRLTTAAEESNEWSLATYPAILGVLYGFLAGLIGAQCVLELKEVCECIKLAVVGNPIWTSFPPYLSSVLCVASVVLQIHFLNLGLAHGEATLVIPTYYVSWTIFGTLGGFAKFHEVNGFSMSQACMFTLGLLMTILCIGFMAVREMEKTDDEIANAVPILIGEDLEPEELHMTRMNQLRQVRIPLSFGFTILPAGNLMAGRRRLYLRENRSALRRVHSDLDLYRDRDNTYNNNTNDDSCQAGVVSRPANACLWTMDGGNITSAAVGGVVKAMHSVAPSLAKVTVNPPTNNNNNNDLCGGAIPSHLDGGGGHHRSSAAAAAGKPKASSAANRMNPRQRHRSAKDLHFDYDEPQQLPSADHHSNNNNNGSNGSTMMMSPSPVNPSPPTMPSSTYCAAAQNHHHHHTRRVSVDVATATDDAETRSLQAPRFSATPSHCSVLNAIDMHPLAFSPTRAVQTAELWAMQKALLRE